MSKIVFNSGPSQLLTASERVTTETLRVPVLRVFDGDGFLTRVRHPEQGHAVEIGVRFGFIDAPEMDQPGGLEAKSFLENIIAEKWLELSILLKEDTGQIFDRHKRLVCVPYLPADQAALSPWSLIKAVISPLGFGSVMRNVELEMVLNGWAWVVEKYGPPSKYLDALEDARHNKRGIWAQTDNVAPWHFKQRHRKIRNHFIATTQRPPVQEALSEIKCPRPNCDGHLAEKNGKFGPFVGCTSFPKCRYTRSV